MIVPDKCTSRHWPNGSMVGLKTKPLRRDDLAAAGQGDWIFERTFPAAISHLRPVATRPDIVGAFGPASPQTELSTAFNCAPRKDQNTGSDEARSGPRR